MKEDIYINTKPLKILSIIILIIAIVIGGNYAYKRHQEAVLESEVADSEAVIPKEDVDLSLYPYARETRYKNPIKYMDVYSYPFQKSEMYVMNKEMQKGTDTLADFAKEIIENIYNTDYQKIISSKDEYEENFKKYLNSDGAFFLLKGPGADEEIMFADEALEAIETYYIENSASSEATFVTNDSLSYEDGYLFCRGVLELETFTKDSAENIKMAIPVEAVFYQDMDNGLFKYCGLIGIEGYDDFNIG